MADGVTSDVLSVVVFVSGIILVSVSKLVAVVKNELLGTGEVDAVVSVEPSAVERKIEETRPEMLENCIVVAGRELATVNERRST